MLIYPHTHHVITTQLLLFQLGPDGVTRTSGPTHFRQNLPPWDSGDFGSRFQGFLNH
jgi:hypothetical protein